MRIGFFLFFIIFTLTSHSQVKYFEITGQIVANETGEPLESATVYLERERDSTLNTYTISDRNGNFLLSGKTYEEELSLFVSYVGYAPYKQVIGIDIEKIQLPVPIKLLTDANSLDEVVIRSVAPITIKKDTLEFNAASFKTRAGATVEDLLKELPGVEVDLEGNITVNGKPVNKLLVNGKPFFGDDPTIATRNLTKEMIEKVQVMDTKTDAEAFTGEEGDQENKTVNLTISEEKNKGTFGRLSAGGGTDERFEYAGIVNRFDGDRRISLLGGGNNTNSPGFSFGEIQKMFGGGSTVMMNSSGGFQIDDKAFGFGKGIVNSRSAGASYADAYGEKMDLSADYFYSGANSVDDETIERENIFPDTRFFTNSISSSRQSNDLHSTNIKFDVKIDSTFLINVRPSISYGTTENFQLRDEVTLDENQEITNQSTLDSRTSSTSKIVKNALDITKRFGERGASLTININNEWNDLEGNDLLNSVTSFSEDPINDENRNQLTDRNQTLNSFFGAIKYTVPIIAKELFIDFRYSYRSDTRKSLRSTFDFNENSQEYDSFNSLLSTDFIFKNSRSTPAIGLSLRKEDFTLSVSGSYLNRILESTDKLRPALSVKQNFEAIEYNTYLNYRFSPQKSVYFNYSLNNSPPTLEQLQPFEDVSDPLNTIIGNPDLEPINTHRAYVSYNNFDFQKGTGLNFYSNFSIVNNQVTPIIVFDENLKRTTTYTNVNGNYNGYLGGNYSKSIKLDTIHNIKINTGVWGNLTKAINFNNEEKFASKYISLTPNVGFTYTWKDILEIKPRYGLSFNRNEYDIAIFGEEEFISHNLRIQTATFLPKNLEWRNDINYNYNPNVAVGFQRSSLFWNSTLAYTILKDRGIITLKAFDLLNQNTNARRSVSQNYIQDVQSTVLQQYFMVSFSWKFNTLGKEGETQSDSPFFFF
ncbi:outer membrane beta-barrel protein [uncultured Planktosalinus sp.]|uniref:outer membrane beta-barrel protein n=1 Tax=uncultured Planktosalinus sp. TaxID=1810935 RepID=UPI0030D76994